MKIILLYTRHWTTFVGPLKWFGRNCTTELASIQQVCTRVYKLKLSCSVNIFYKALGENTQWLHKPILFHSLLRCSYIITGVVHERANFLNQKLSLLRGIFIIFTHHSCSLSVRFRLSISSLTTNIWGVTQLPTRAGVTWGVTQRSTPKIPNSSNVIIQCST